MPVRAGMMVLQAALVAAQALLDAVHGLGARGQHLADPVGLEGDGRGLGQDGHARAAPASEVGHDRPAVTLEVKLGLLQQHPAARAAATEPEGTGQLVIQRAGRGRMRRRGTRAEIEIATQDLGDEMRGRVEHVLIGGPRLAARCPPGRGEPEHWRVDHQVHERERSTDWAGRGSTH